VRSGRLVDPELARMYQGVLAFSGANPENVLPRIQELMGDRIITENNCPGLCRDDYTVMGVFANTADINQRHASQRRRNRQSRFDRHAL